MEGQPLFWGEPKKGTQKKRSGEKEEDKDEVGVFVYGPEGVTAWVKFVSKDELSVSVAPGTLVTVSNQMQPIQFVGDPTLSKNEEAQTHK